MILLVLSLLTGCADNENYTAYPFVGAEWTRSTEQDTEYLYFSDKGEFSYSCACGNPVNDADLCEGYTYDPESKTITLQYTETTDGTVTTLRVVTCTDTELVLLFNDETRTFYKNEEMPKTDTVTYGDRVYHLLVYPTDVFYYDLALDVDLVVDVDYEEDAVCPIAHDKWDFVYSGGDVFVSEGGLAAATAYYGDDGNYDWWVRVEDVESELSYTLPLMLSEAESVYLYGMDEQERRETLLFEEIEQFATLGKTSKDGTITAVTELAWHNGAWYWRSEIIDEKTEGWPEYIVPLPQSLSKRIGAPKND